MPKEIIYEPYGDIRNRLFDRFARANNQITIVEDEYDGGKLIAIWVGDGVICVSKDDEAAALIDNPENRRIALNEYFKAVKNK